MKYQKKVIKMVIKSEPFLYVKSAVLNYVHEQGVNCSESVWRGSVLQEKIKHILDEAVLRARKNFRKTVIDRDL